MFSGLRPSSEPGRKSVVLQLLLHISSLGLVLAAFAQFVEIGGGNIGSPPTSSSLGDEKHVLNPPQHGGARSVRRHNEPMRAADYAFFDVPFTAFAHRGRATYEPNLYRENSLHAFKEAVALGYRYLETDVHATRDGVLLAFHDRVLDRVTDHTGAIAEMTYAEISGQGSTDWIPCTLSELLAEFRTPGSTSTRNHRQR